MRVSYDARLVGFAGIGRFIVGLWGALLDEGADLAVLGLGGRKAGIDYLGDVGYPQPGPTVPVGARPLFPLEQLTLPPLLRRLNVDVHHSPHLAVPYLSRRPIVLTVHDLFMYKDPRKARSTVAGAYYRAVFPRALRRADLVVGGSEYASREVQEVLGIPASKVRTVDYGLDHEQWQRPGDDVVDEVLTRLQVRQPYLLYVGTAKHHKNLGTLLAAHARDPELPPLVLAGPTEAELAVGAPSVPRGRVQVLGRVADRDLPALYAGAVAHALPSLYESVGFTALEAMACGTPVVSSDGGGLPTTVGDAGLLVPVADLDAWTSALAQVSSDANLRSMLVERGRARAGERSWKRAALTYLDIYSELSA